MNSWPIGRPAKRMPAPPRRRPPRRSWGGAQPGESSSSTRTRCEACRLDVAQLRRGEISTRLDHFQIGSRFVELRRPSSIHRAVGRGSGESGAQPRRHGSPSTNSGSLQILPTRSSTGFSVFSPCVHLAGHTSPGWEATYWAARTLRSSSWRHARCRCRGSRTSLISPGVDDERAAQREPGSLLPDQDVEVRGQPDRGSPSNGYFTF